MRVPFIGPSYVYESLTFDCQRSVNLFVTTSEVGTSKSKQALAQTPGLRTFCTLTDSPTRGSLIINGRSFFVSGASFFEVSANGSATLRGTLATVDGVVGMASNGLEVCVVDGNNGYIFTLATNVFSQIVSDGWRGSYSVTFVDGYFIFAEPNTGIFYISQLYNGGQFDALDFASAEGSPDNIVSVRAVHNQLWVFGNQSIEIYYNSGAADFPFSRIQGTFIEYGCAAANSVANTANTVFWLGQDADGKGVVWMAQGYQPQRISTYPIEFAISQYGTINDAVGYVYQERGHYFYVLNFTNANTTWCYDIGESLWHERNFLNADTGDFERGRPNNHIFAFDKHLVGDYANGKVYEQSQEIYDDDGSEIVRLRTSPHQYSDDIDYIFFSQFQIDMQAGVGLVTGGVQNVIPQVMLQYSNDGGFTWSSELWSDAGRIGEYKKRIIWNRLGRARDRVWRIKFSSACKCFIVAASCDMQKGNS